MNIDLNAPIWAIDHLAQVLCVSIDTAREHTYDRVTALREHADIVVIDSGEIHEAVRDVVPGGVDVTSSSSGPTRCATPCSRSRAAEPSASPACCRPVDGQGLLSIDFLPNTVRLSAYSGEASDLPADVLQSFLDDVAAGTATVPIARTYRLDEIVQAHGDMEAGVLVGKGVVLTGR